MELCDSKKMLCPFLKSNRGVVWSTVSSVSVTGHTICFAPLMRNEEKQKKKFDAVFAFAGAPSTERTKDIILLRIQRQKRQTSLSAQVHKDKKRQTSRAKCEKEEKIGI